MISETRQALPMRAVTNLSYSKSHLNRNGMPTSYEKLQSELSFAAQTWKTDLATQTKMSAYRGFRIEGFAVDPHNRFARIKPHACKLFKCWLNLSNPLWIMHLGDCISKLHIYILRFVGGCIKGMRTREKESWDIKKESDLPLVKERSFIRKGELARVNTRSFLFKPASFGEGLYSFGPLRMYAVSYTHLTLPTNREV